MQMWKDDDYLNMKHGIYEIRGAAGAGKTFQLTTDIRSLHRKGKHLAVISFSNAAVDELASRLGNTTLILRTIHSFCWQIIGSVSRKILEYTDELSNFIPEGLGQYPDYALKDVKSVLYGEIGIPQFNAKTGELWLSHDDVIHLFIQALRCVPSFSNLITSTFDYILIDEYQDTNGDFLRALFDEIAPRVTIGIYGDPFQSIYLNQQTLNIADACDKYAIRTYCLPNNYRSQAVLVDMYNCARESFDGLKQNAQIPMKSGPRVFIGKGQISADIVSAINRSMNFSDSVVLSVTNGLRLSAAGFGDIAKKIRQWIPTREGNADWPEVLRSEQLSPYVRGLVEYGRLLFGSDYESVQALLKLFTSESIHAVGINAIRKVLDNEKKSRVVDTVNYTKIGLHFNSEIRSMVDRLGIFSFEDLHHIIDFYNALNDINRQSMTIYASKGLEFENVILNIDYGWYRIRNWNAIDFNHSERDVRNINSDIMSYLFYVGITRAKDGLAIFVNSGLHPNFERQLSVKFPNKLTFVRL